MTTEDNSATDRRHEEPLEDGQPAKTYQTPQIAVAWYPRRCIHSALCLYGDNDVFDASRRPWVVLVGADPDHVAEVIRTCPSGALHYTRLDGEPQEAPDAEPSVIVVPNGPLFVRGHVQVLSDAGEVIRTDSRMALCRCGASGNKPFCDNSHRRIGFTAT